MKHELSIDSKTSMCTSEVTRQVRQGGPSLWLARASSGSSAVDLEWTKHIHTNECERRCFCDSFLWKIGHDLALLLPSEPLASDTLFDHLGDLLLATNDPVAFISQGTQGDVSALMTTQLMVVLDD